MLVGDIYGGDCPSIGLRADVIAASFGKVSIQRAEERRRGPMFLFRYLAALTRHYEEGFWLVILAVINTLPGVKQLATYVGLTRFAEARAASVAMCGGYRAHDVALSLLRMVSNNIGHIACLSAQQNGLKHILFGGSFIRDHPYTIATISSAVSFYSAGTVQALFLKHDGFVGAVGAHMTGHPSVGAQQKMADPPDRVGPTLEAPASDATTAWQQVAPPLVERSAAAPTATRHGAGPQDRPAAGSMTARPAAATLLGRADSRRIDEVDA